MALEKILKGGSFGDLVQRPVNKFRLRSFKKRADKLKEKVFFQRCLYENCVYADPLSGRHHSKSDLFEIAEMAMRRSRFDGLIQIYLTNLQTELENLSTVLGRGSNSQLSDFLQILIAQNPDSIDTYTRLFRVASQKYEASSVNVIGTPFQDSLLDFMLERDGVFMTKCKGQSFEQIGDGVKGEFRNYAINMKRIYDFDFEGVMAEYLGLLQDLRALFPNDYRLTVPFTRNIPSFSDFKPAKKDPRNPTQQRIEKAKEGTGGLKRLISQQEDWSNVGKLIADFCQETRKLQDSETYTIGMHPMFGPMLVPTTKRKAVDLSDLVGYETQKKQLVDNTEKLLKGKEANNVFIKGPPGTGKSSMVNALLTKYSKDGLRILEIDKRMAPYLPAVFNQIEQMEDNKFIVLIDEFKLGEDEDLYTELKTMIEGSFGGLPSNAKMYVISNHEGALKMGFKTSEDGDDEEAGRALEDRFGLIVKFGYLTEESDQREVLKHYLKKARAKSFDEDELYAGFQQYLGGRNIKNPNPRNVENYVKTLDLEVEEEPEKAEEVVKEGEFVPDKDQEEAVNEKLEQGLRAMSSYTGLPLPDDLSKRIRLVHLAEDFGSNSK